VSGWQATVLIVTAEKEPPMSITITHPQAASRRARYGAIAALVAGASLVGYWGVQTLTDDPATTITTPAHDEVSAQVADWADADGASGLSPASVSVPPTDDVSAQVADWARANGVSGLSPASVGAPG
jgi:hypothetical protein